MDKGRGRSGWVTWIKEGEGWWGCIDNERGRGGWVTWIKEGGGLVGSHG